MDTPERSMVGGGGTPLSNKFEDSPVFNFLNNLSPIQPVKSTVQAYQPLSYALFTSPHTNPPKAPRPPIRNDSTEASKTEILPTNHGVQSSTQKPVTSPENSTKFPSQESNKPIVFDSGSPDHNTTYNRAFKTSFRVDDVSKGPVQRKSLFASETSTGHKDDDVAECDWEYLLSGNPEDLLLCDPSSGEETGDSISDPLLINNTQPNGLEDCDVHVDHMSYKLETQQQRGMRRRCLVFDPSISISSSSSSRGKMVSQSPLKPKKKAPVLSSLPGIGLHLNSLTAPSNDMMSIHACSVQVSQPKLLTIENNLDSTSENMHEELALAIVPLDSTDPSSNSPKKRRKKVESGDGEACKRCSCKKSKCLKLYCECFAAGVYCSEPCACQGCFNKPIHEETVLSTRKQIEFRNPLAFAPKVVRALDSVQEIREDFNNTPASARHKRGCNCKKSSCLKKYCECFQGGVGCSLSCRCDSCKNTFGRREDALPMVGEEINGCDEEETQEIENSSAPSLEDLDPITPRFEALGTRMKPSRPLNISSHSLLKCREDESPDLFVNENSGIGGVMKTSSPNGKRVSPPQTGKLIPPIYKGGRKLILRSIPSLSRNTFNDCFVNNPNSGTSFDSSRLTGGL